MTVTVQLPPNVEQAYLSAAKEMGVSLDTLVADVLLSHVPVTDPLSVPKLIEENGIPVLRTGQPLDPQIVAETMMQIRKERDLSALGQP